MRVPATLLDRVRGAVVLAAITSACGTEAPAPAVSSVVAMAPIAMPPAPIDPVRYASTSEDARLLRIEAEGTASERVRETRIDRLNDARRADDEQRRAQEYAHMRRRILAMCGRG
jgi:hypothetical protein